jgi:hypothetical protein
MLISFLELETRFGMVAYELLSEIEKAAGLAPAHALDPETRLRNALRAQDAQVSEAA